MRYLVLPAIVLSCVAFAGPARADLKNPENDKEFIPAALSRDVAQIEIANLAVKKADSEDVRKLATKIRDDHTKFKSDLMEQAKNMKIGVVTGLEKENRATLAALALKTGKDFDTAYLDYVIESHTNCCDLYSKWNKGTKDETLSGWSKKAHDKVKAHLDEAKKLRDAK